MPDSLGETHVVVDFPNTPEIVVVSYDVELMEGFEDKDNPKEDQEVNKAVGEQQVDQEVHEVELGVSDSSFD